MREQVDKGRPLFREEVAFIDDISPHEYSRKCVGEAPLPHNCRATHLEMIGQGDNFLEFIFLLSPS